MTFYGHVFALISFENLPSTLSISIFIILAWTEMFRMALAVPVSQQPLRFGKFCSMHRLGWRLFLLFGVSALQLVKVIASAPSRGTSVSHRQHEATLSSVRFLIKLHFHEESSGDFENYHLFHTCEPMGNLSPYDQRVGNENTTFFL